jgi:hypothetical protein
MDTRVGLTCGPSKVACPGAGTCDASEDVFDGKESNEASLKTKPDAIGDRMKAWNGLENGYNG